MGMLPPSEHWEALSKTRVAFGHQSVGGNILNGLNTLARQASVTLRVNESRDLSSEANIIHFRIGQNGDPSSKLRDFSDVVSKSSSDTIDIAMMKLCYLDFTGEVDPLKIANEYAATLDRLRAAHPRTKFVAFTAPLTIRQTGPRAWLKRMMGRSPSGYSENVRRSQFNERLRARYSASGQLFDLAQIESEGLATYELNGQPFQALNAALTDDGGHLNAAGERLVALRLLEFLSALSRPS